MVIVLYSGLLAALTGAGGLLGRALQRGGRGRVFTSLAVGISCLHALTLLGLPIALVLAVIFGMAAVEGILWLKRSEFASTFPVADLRWIALVFATALPLWVFVMCRPLWAFDARNAWFFSGRIIFMEGRLPFEAFHRLLCHWGPDYRLNMSPDYPKLVGSLTAAVATLAGYWNEFLPKISILILYTLSLIGLVELGWSVLAVALNVLVSVVTKYRAFFDSASLDIHVALLLFIGLASLAKAWDERAGEGQAGDGGLSTLGMSVAAIAVVSQLKYEGRALTAIVLVAALITRVVKVVDLRRVAPLCVLFLPTAMWLVEVRVFGLPSYLDRGGGLPVALSRFRKEYFSFILPHIMTESAVVTGVALSTIGLAVATRLDPRWSIATLARDPVVRLGAITALGYTAALSVVYLMTPYPTVWEHMSVSVDRVTLPIEAALLASTVSVLGRAARARLALAVPRPS